jgi:hypothetical protein
VVAVADPGPLLLGTGDVGPGATELDAPPYGELSSVLWCDRAVSQDGKTAEAERSFTAGGDGDYRVDAYVAAFAPGAAGPFMDRLIATAERCATTGRPAAYAPPPGADRALRLTTGKRDAIWLSTGDHVVKVDVAFGAGGDVEVDPATAPDLAARALARARPGG